MKAATFEYSRPRDLDEACALLAAEEGARVIAGGQTLVPLMAMRLARPTRLVDIARIPELSFVREEGDAVVIGAATRQALVERDALARDKLPLLAKALPYVGHSATRARGTIGGSLANADPAAEIALVAATLGATLVWRDGAATHEVAAADFFLGPMFTALPPSGCLLAARFPIWCEPRLGVGFHEVNARQSDFAYVSAAAQIAVDEQGLCRRVALGLGAAAAFPLRLDAVADALIGTRAEAAAVRAAVAAALGDIEMMADLHTTAEYRRRVALTLGTRAIADAYAAASGVRP